MENSPITFERDSLTQEMVTKSQVYVNLGQGIIVTTEDKIELCLKNHLEAMERRQEWIAPLGLAASIFLTLLTADFKDWLLPKYTWQAIFIIALVLSLGWLIFSLRYAFKPRTIDDVMREIKKGAIKTTREDGATGVMAGAGPVDAVGQKLG